MPRAPKTIDRTSDERKSVDDDVDAITAWYRWFITAHAQRLADLHLPAEQYDRELAACVGIGTAVAERMRSDHVARTR